MVHDHHWDLIPPSAYEQILASVEKEEHKSLVLTAAAIAAFAQKQYTTCKTLLFKAYVCLDMLTAWFVIITF